MEIKVGDVLNIDELIRLEVSERLKIAIHGKEGEEGEPTYDTMAERDLEALTSADGGVVRYRVKKIDEAKREVEVIREVTWK